MKLTTGILFLGMVAGTAWGQNPDVIENTRNTMKAAQQKKAMDSDAALSASQGSPASASSANPAAPASSQPTAAKHPSAKQASSQPVALKVKSPAGHKKSQPKQQIAVENQKKPAEAKPEAGRTARSLCQSGGQSQHAGFGLQFRQALPDHRPDQP